MPEQQTPSVVEARKVPVEEKGRITEVVLNQFKADKIAVHLLARIDDAGELILEGYDSGRFVEEHWGDSDYEYWLKIAEKYKDTLLLWLIKERFSSESEFRRWLEEKRIPHTFESWV